MSNLNRVYDSTLLTNSKVYQIDRTLYQYLYKTGTIQHPRVPLSTSGRTTKEG
jgi:hypothetical protein